jgi:cytochrome c2
VRGPTAIALALGIAATCLGAASGASYVAQARAEGGPASLAEFAARAVRPAGPLPAGRGAEVLARYGCLSCHAVDGRGARVGPELNGVRGRRSREEIIEWLRDPQAMKPGTAMPTFGLSRTEREMLADYLMTK